MPNNFYPDLPLTNFPENLDQFLTYLNIASSDGQYVVQYQQAMSVGNTTLANQALEQISSASQKIIKATDLNKLSQAMLAVERFYKTDIEPYIDTQQSSWLNTINRFRYLGEWTSGTSYQQNNMVTYTSSGLTLLFIATDNPPLGTPPSNTTYWRMLTIQGPEGPSGEGLTYLQQWESSKTYQENDAVTYGGGLWMALQENTNIEPGTNDQFWQLVLPVIMTTYPIQPTEPTVQTAGDLWFNTQENPTKYYYLEALENPAGPAQITAGYQAYDANGNIITGTRA